MDVNNLSVVFIIENYFQERVLASNPILSSPIKASFFYNKIKPGLFRGESLDIDFIKISDVFEKTAKSINTDWILYLKPEEQISSFTNNNLNPGCYNILVETFIDKLPQNNFICFEQRLFHKNADKVEVYNSPEINNIKISTFINSELEKQKLIKYIDLYEKGTFEPEIISFLIKNKYFGTDFEQFLPLINSLPKTPEKLKLFVEISKVYLASDLLENAEKILTIGVELFENSVTLNYLIGELYYVMKKYNKSVRYLEECLRLKESNNFYKYIPFPRSIMGYITYYSAGRTYHEKGNLYEAKDYIEKSLQIYPDFQLAKDKLKVINKDINNYVENEAPNEMDFACQSCGNCCRGFNINVTHVDILKIMKNRPDLKAEDIFHIRKIDKNDINYELFLGNDSGNNVLALKRKENSSDCIFLDENNMCTIHDFKPVGCRVWPFSIRLNDGRIKWNTYYKEFIARFCGHTFRKKANDPKTLIKYFNQLYENENEYREIIVEWNHKLEKQNYLNKEQKEVTTNDFLNFILGSKSSDKTMSLINEFTEFFSSETKISLIVENPFISIHESKKDNRVYIGIYVNENEFDEYTKTTNLKDIRTKLNSEYAYHNIYPYEHYRYYKNGIFMYLYFYPFKADEKIFKDSQILFKRNSESLELCEYEEMLINEFSEIRRGFYEKIQLASNYINQGNFNKSYSLLEYILLKYIKAMIYWLNKKNFSTVDIPFLEFKTDNLSNLLSSYLNYKLYYEEQKEFMNKLIDIFENLMQKTNIQM